MSKSYIDIAQLRAVQDRKFEDVSIPEWGGTVKIQSLTSEEHMQSMLVAGEDKTKMHATVVSLGLVSPKLTDGDSEWLKQKGAGPLQRLFNRIYVLSGLLKDDDAKELEKSGNSKSSSSAPPEGE